MNIETFAPPGNLSISRKIVLQPSHTASRSSDRRYCNELHRRNAKVNQKLNQKLSVRPQLNDVEDRIVQLLSNLAIQYCHGLRLGNMAFEVETAILNAAHLHTMEKILCKLPPSRIDPILTELNISLQHDDIRLIALEGEIWLGMRDNVRSPYYLSTALIAKQPWQICPHHNARPA